MINDGKKYNCKETFDFQGEKILEGDMIGVFCIQSPVAYCTVYRKEATCRVCIGTIEINLARLEQHIAMESEATDFGTCKACPNMLDGYSDIKSGTGYVCPSCANE